MNDYIDKALRTNAPVDAVFERIANNQEIIHLLHAVLGISGESGELVDAFKKHIFYGKPLDKENMVEELGDLFWYCAIAANYLGVDFNTIMRKNIAKLQARYPNKFTEECATNRDLDNEKQVLANS